MKWLGVAMSLILTQNLSCLSFDKKALSDHIRILASDEFEGRLPMTKGEERTLLYLEERFKDFGLKELKGFEGYRQRVPLARVTTTVDTPITLGNLILKTGEDVALSSSSVRENIDLFQVPVIFLGYGISANEWHWDDYAHVDVKNKIVVTLVNDPGFSSGTHFNGKAMTYYGRWTYKFEEAERRGALGVLVIHETDAAGYGFHVVNQKDGHLILNDDRRKDGLVIQGWLSREAAINIFKNTHLDFDDMKNKALSPGKATTSLGTLSLKASNRVECGNSYNLCGFLSGSKTDDYIAISAHWDHLGVKINHRGQRDIYRGAIDNGSGVAASLELARYFSRQLPKKNLVFCSFTAEEQGLLGAKYFLDHPPMALSSIKGMLNFDCLNVGQKSKSVVLYGGKEGKLASLLYDEVARQKRIVIDDPHGEKGYFFRSDHYPFIRKGIKALLFMDIGVTDPNYLLNSYHQPSDKYNRSWPLDGMMQDLDLFKNLILRL